METTLKCNVLEVDKQLHKNSLKQMKQILFPIFSVSSVNIFNEVELI